MQSDYIQVAGIRGTPNRSKNALSMVLDDFYTLCLKDPRDNIGLRFKVRKDGLIVFKRSDVCLDYLCSDFARFCLALYKNNGQNINKNMYMIPLTPIPISEELKQYIEEFLPDFYDIRTN